MQIIAEWLTTSRARALSGAALLAFLSLLLPFGSWLPGALLVLLALRAGPGPDWLAGVIAGAMLAWWLTNAGAGPVPVALVSLALVGPPLLLGRELARGRSLNLAFQLATVGALVLLVVVHAVLADPPGVWRPFLEKIAAELDRVGILVSNVGSGRGPSQSDLIEASAARMWGVVAWVLLLNTMIAGFVGLYCAGLLAKAERLGPAFRDLKAGRSLATLAAVVGLISLASGWGWPTDATWVFLGAFVLQGLAILHSACKTLSLGTGWLALVYVLLFIPFTTLFVQGALALFGFVDNWFPLRARLAARAAGRDD